MSYLAVIKHTQDLEYFDTLEQAKKYCNGLEATIYKEVKEVTL